MFTSLYFIHTEKPKNCCCVTFRQMRKLKLRLNEKPKASKLVHSEAEQNLKLNHWLKLDCLNWNPPCGAWKLAPFNLCESWSMVWPPNLDSFNHTMDNDSNIKSHSTCPWITIWLMLPWVPEGYTGSALSHTTNVPLKSVHPRRFFKALQHTLSLARHKGQGWLPCFRDADTEPQRSCDLPRSPALLWAVQE